MWRVELINLENYAENTERWFGTPANPGALSNSVDPKCSLSHEDDGHFSADLTSRPRKRQAPKLTPGCTENFGGIGQRLLL
jgi:hypothetical protein